MPRETETKWIKVKDLKTNEWAEVIIGDYGGRIDSSPRLKPGDS